MAGMIIIKGDTPREIFELLNGLCASAEALAGCEEDNQDISNQDVSDQDVMTWNGGEEENFDDDPDGSQAAFAAETKRQLLLAEARRILNGTIPAGPAGLAEVLMSAGGWTIEQIARLLDVSVDGIEAIVYKEACYPYVLQAFQRDFPPSSGEPPVAGSVPTRKEAKEKKELELKGAAEKMTPKRRQGKKPFRPDGPVDLSGCKTIQDAVATAIAHWGGHVSSLARSENMDLNCLKHAIADNRATPRVLAYLVANKFKAEGEK